jgi:hypothetical protein
MKILSGFYYPQERINNSRYKFLINSVVSLVRLLITIFKLFLNVIPFPFFPILT